VVPGAHERITGLEHLDKVIDIDQTPIGRTPRSNPATYTGLFTPIRELFAEMPESKLRGYGPGRFSFNVKGGRCEACQGDGLVKIEMHFLPDVYVTCEQCRGKRYNRETLDVKFRGLSISEVLDLTVEDAISMFENQPRIHHKLVTLNDVGLGYIHLGQSATTLSGGEAQRVKLATELSRRDTGRTLYILDEPTTGLHFEDVRVLLDVLHKLVDRGNTVLVIEHNLDVIKTADWIVDLGTRGWLRRRSDRGSRVRLRMSRR
jgi:excinuclease ABC subunit A